MIETINQTDKIATVTQQARESALLLATLPRAVKDKAILQMAAALVEHKEFILEANTEDLQAAHEAGYSEPDIDYLRLDELRIQEMAHGLRQIAGLSDPVGEVMEGWSTVNGVHIQKMRVPIGVVGVLFEDRPYLVVDAAALCLKSGNAVLLWSSRSGFSTSLTLSRILSHAAEISGVPAYAIQLVESHDLSCVERLIQMPAAIDAIIPKGNEAWVHYVRQNSRVPVIATTPPRAHLYIHEDADLHLVRSILLESKRRKRGTRVPIQGVLIHRSLAAELAPELCQYWQAMQVDVYACEWLRKKMIRAAPALDYDMENPNAVLIETVSNLEDAIVHIQQFGNHHSEGILTGSLEAARRFASAIDAACVYINASPHLTGGYEFGFGTQVGVSTQKLHARGPIGLKELTTYKYLIYGG